MYGQFRPQWSPLHMDHNCLDETTSLIKHDISGSKIVDDSVDEWSYMDMEVEHVNKVPYPKSVAFIIGNEFCERFCFYGMRTILVLYLTRTLNYDADSATKMFHAFTGLAFFFPIIGAIISDSWLGRFKTILYMSCVYMAGNVVIAIGAIPVLNLPANTFTLLGLLLIAIGTGGIKPCVTAFGGDQFKLPEQAAQLAFFFSLFYMAINAGSLFSTVITPILREDVQCFGDDSCFSLAFGVPSVLMLISLCRIAEESRAHFVFKLISISLVIIVIFVAGRPFYKITNPRGNMIFDVTKCIGNAVWTKWKVEKPSETNGRSHWLDYAEAQHGARLVDDVKVLLKLLLLFLPLPLFWALQDQQGSRWTLQATRLDGKIGGLTIKPDQMQIINPVLIIALIPLWDVFVYRWFAYFGVTRSLQKLTVGMIFAGLAFFASGVLELHIEVLDPVRPGPGQCRLRIYNGLDESVTFHTDLLHALNVDSMDMLERKHIDVKQFQTIEFIAKLQDGRSVSGAFEMKSGKSVSYFVTRVNQKVRLIEFEESPGTPYQAIPQVRLLATTFKEEAFLFSSIDGRIHHAFYTNSTDLQSVAAGAYEINVGDQIVQEVRIDEGGSYTLLLLEVSPGKFQSEFLTIIAPNHIHILWQLPQYVFLTVGEIMFSVTGLEFSFNESPDAMKSVVQACWQLTVTFGNLFVVVVAHMAFFELQSSEFFFFTFLMFIDVVVFAVLATRYRYRSDGKNTQAMENRAPGEEYNK